MSRLRARRIATVMGIGCLVVTGLVTTLFWEEIVIRYHIHVLRYGNGPSRDHAFRSVIALGRYRGDIHDREETEGKGVKHVVECPQLGGGLILAVINDLPEESNQGDSAVTLIDMDGSIIPSYLNWDDGTGWKKWQDVNGDGCIERVETLNVGWGESEHDGNAANVLVVLPMSREQRPILLVAYNYGAGNRDWSWRLKPTSGEKVFDIEIGPQNGVNGVKPWVVFRWSPEEKSYVGPQGGKDQPFFRLKDLEECKQVVDEKQ